MIDLTKYSPATQRFAAFLSVSMACHLVLAAGFVGFSLDLDVPKPDITWLDLDNKLGAPAARPAPPPPKPAQKAVVKPTPKKKEWKVKKRVPAKKKKKRLKKKKKKVAAKPKPKPKPVKRDMTPFTTEKVALGTLAPGDAALMLLMRMDRLRGSPYEREVRQLLEVFYDHKTLLWNSGLDPIKDFEAMLIATPNPYRVTRTFLAVRHNLPAWKMRRNLSRAARYKTKRMRWRRQRDGYRGVIPSPPRHPKDPRVVIVKRNVVMLTDPAHIPLLTLDSSPDKKAPDAGPPARTWVQRLEQMDAAGGHGEGPGLLLQAINLPRLIRLPRDFKTPQGFRLTIPAKAPADHHAILTFASEGDAKIFLAAVPRRIKQAKRSLLLRFMGVTDILERIKLSRKGKVVEARVTLTGDQVRGLLGIIRNMIPQIKVPGMKQNRVPDMGAPDSRRPDAGPARGGPDAGVAAPDAGGAAADPIITPEWAK